MKLDLAPGALTGSLWPKHPVIRSTGLVLDIGLSTPTPATQRSFTCVAFAPFDDHLMCLGDSTGAVFTVHLQRNRYTLVARLSQPATDITFANEKGAIAVSAGMAVALIDTSKGRQLGRLRGPHRNNIVRVVSPPLPRGVLVSVSTDAVAFWGVNDAKCLAVEHGRFMDAATSAGEDLFTLESGSTVKAWSLADRKQRQSVTLAGHRLRRIAASNAVVVCGTDTSAVVVFRANTLSPMWVTAVHSEARCVHVAHCGANLFSVMQADGIVSYMAVGKPAAVGGHSGQPLCIDHHDPPRDRENNASGGDDALVIGQSLELCIPVDHVPRATAASRAHYAAVMSATALQVYHLPTAKMAHDGIIAAQHSTTSSGKAVIRPFVTVGGSDRDEKRRGGGDRSTTPGAPDDEADDAAATLPPAAESRPVAAPPADDTVQKAWVKVNLLQSSNKATVGSDKVGQPMFASDAVRKKYADASALSNATTASTSSVAAVRLRDKENSGSGGGGAAKPAAATPVPRTPAASTIKKPSRSGGSGATPSDDVSSISIDSLINLRDLGDEHARSVNADKLRGILMKFGVFPERYRAYVWRFLLGYSDKEVTAPRFAVLAGRGVHPGVQQLLKPFPLPDSRLRNAFEKTLSCLGHHAPVFAVAHYVPSIVFPFMSVFNSDVQSTVECVLSFVCDNWGTEFFQYYPHMPVALVSLITHVLKAEEPELLQHFVDVGLGPEVYVWDVMSALYTEVLSRNEWLQVMDHALINEPLWLWMFHVRWLAQLKPSLMALKDPVNLAAAFRRATPFDINATVQQTYRLHGRCPRNELTRPYERLSLPPRGDYPMPLEVHESIVTSRLEELEALQKHEQAVVGLHERTRAIERQLADAAMVEDAFVGRQRALVAAKFDGAGAVWSQRVVLEQERNRLRDLEHEARLKAVQAQLSTASRLEQVQQDITVASTAQQQRAMDREQEALKWRFADRMANVEVERLEANANARLASMMHNVGPAGQVDGHAIEEIRSDPDAAGSQQQVQQQVVVVPGLNQTREHSAATRDQSRSQEAASRTLGNVTVDYSQAPVAVPASHQRWDPQGRCAEHTATATSGDDEGTMASGTASSVPQPDSHGPPAPSPRPSPEHDEEHRPRHASSSASSGSPAVAGRRGQALLYDPDGQQEDLTVAARTTSHRNSNNTNTKARQASRSPSAVLLDVSGDVAGRPPPAPGRASSGEQSTKSPSHGAASEGTEVTFAGQTATTTTTGDDAGSTTTTTTTSTSGQVTTDCDASSHFHQLHLQIRQRVEQAQREQRAAMAALRSRYARTADRAMRGESGTSDTMFTTTNSAEGHTATSSGADYDQYDTVEERRYRFTEEAGGAAGASHYRRGTADDDEDDGVSAETSVTELHVDDDGTDVSEATDRSSVVEALMRRQDPRFFDFHRRTAASGERR